MRISADISLFKTLLTALFFALGALPSAQAQTFTGGSGPIHDVATIDIPLVVTGLIPANIDTIGFGLETVCIDLVHTYNSDLEITLVAPDGTTAALISRQGGGDDNFTNTCLNQYAPLTISQGVAPWTGTFQPSGQMGLVNNLQNGNGTWFLRVADLAGADTGFVFSWSITFGNQPATYFNVSATNLPIVLINTNGQTIVNDPKIMARMRIIDNGLGNINHVTDPPNAYDGWIGIEVRGNSSQSFAQKQYRFETRDSFGSNLETSLLGLPIENDWILYAPYSDKSCMRNHLAYALSRDMGVYAVRGKYCEVFLDGAYHGIYEITESIKRDSNRVDISKLTNNDLSGDQLTGGYIVKIDWIGGAYWQSNYPPDQTAPYNNVINFQCIEPKETNIQPAQQNYIQLYVDSFETALNGPIFADTALGWRRFANERSFIDYFILNELAKNVDAYWLSTYFSKDRDSKGGKLKMGPSWDFNGGWHGADYCDAPSPTGWHFNEPDYCAVDMPIWWKRLMQDTLYGNNMQCRWRELRSTVLDTLHIFHEMDSVAALIDQGTDRHFRQWPILGTYVWPNPAPLANTFEEELTYTKQWIVQRLAWMDANIPGTCYPPVVGTQSPILPHIAVYPNPSTGTFRVTSTETMEELTVTDLLGKIVLQVRPDAPNYVVQMTQPGLYFVSVMIEGSLQTQKITVSK